MHPLLEEHQSSSRPPDSGWYFVIPENGLLKLEGIEPMTS
jgi:hypothetical protein